MNDLAEISKLWIDYREMLRAALRQPGLPYFQAEASKLYMKLLCAQAVYWSERRVP